MRFKGLAIIALTLMVLAPATGAFAVVTCGAANDLGGGNVEMLVTAGVGNFNGVTLDMEVGGAVVSFNDCAVGQASCTFSVQGIPGGALPQSGSIAFRDEGGPPPVVCEITDADGLPVELVEFSVE